MDGWMESSRALRLRCGAVLWAMLWLGWMEERCFCSSVGIDTLLVVFSCLVENECSSGAM